MFPDILVLDFAVGCLSRPNVGFLDTKRRDEEDTFPRGDAVTRWKCARCYVKGRIMDPVTLVRPEL